MSQDSLKMKPCAHQWKLTDSGFVCRDCLLPAPPDAFTPSASTGRKEMGMARVEVDVDLPTLPNFVRVGGNPVDVADLSDDTLRDIGKEWTEALIKHALDRRVNRVASRY